MAMISDIHANYIALEAALSSLETEYVEFRLHPQFPPLA
jgi:hypothetical protein